MDSSNKVYSLFPGAVAKKSLEDKRAPMYHVRNMIGSAKNAMYSAMKIAPQDILIPSQYKVVDTTTHQVVPHGSNMYSSTAYAPNFYQSNQLVGSPNLPHQYIPNHPMPNQNMLYQSSSYSNGLNLRTAPLLESTNGKTSFILNTKQ